jgi:predicted lactoylglutathione lyase
MYNTTRIKSVSLNEETYNELISLSSGYKESIDDIVKKCIKAYRKVNKK